MKLLINIVENESTPVLRNDNDVIEGSFSDEDAKEDQFLTSKGKSKRRDKYGYYSSKLFYLKFKMMKTILFIDSLALKKILAFLSNL